MAEAAKPRRRIIIVDDEPNILGIMARIVGFIATDCEIVPVESAHEALAAMEGHDVPLVFTDYNMPEMNGLALLAEITRRAPTTAVAMITAYFSTDLQRQASELGARYMLPKPMEFEEIERICRELGLVAAPTSSH